MQPPVHVTSHDQGLSLQCKIHMGEVKAEVEPPLVDAAERSMHDSTEWQ